MRTWIKVFLSVGAFLGTTATSYWFLTYEDAGTVLLAGAALMAAIVGGWLLHADRGAEATPADRPEAESKDLAGIPVGSFASSSAWPVVLAVGVLFVGMGLVYSLILLPLGLVVTTVAVLGLVRESDS